MYSNACCHYQWFRPLYNWNGYYWGSNGDQYSRAVTYQWNWYDQMNIGEDFLERVVTLQDYGPNPFVINIEDATEQNTAFRRALWTGDHLQVTLMSLNVGEDIGLENHPTTDQFLRVEEGKGFVQMGDRADHLTFQQNVKEDDAIVVPAGTWHNITNTGNKPMKLYSIYAPPKHPFGTVHLTKADAQAAEEHD